MDEQHRAISADQVWPEAYGGGLQPWSEVVMPPVGGEGWPWPQATAMRAMRIPAVARGVGLIADLVRSMPMDLVRQGKVQPRPRLLEQPVPDAGTSWFIGVQVEDYLLHGNALHYVTSRGYDGYPLSVAWLPAQWVGVAEDEDHPGQISYWIAGRRLATENVVHVRRGADRSFPRRGMGIVEEHFETLARVQDQSTYESRQLRNGGVPSVAVIVDNANLSQEEADAAKTQWVAKYGGTSREPAILPKGTEVKPLAWSPHDSQMVEARKLTLQDVANLLRIDGFWLGADSPGLQYKSAGPMFTNLVRQTINPILGDFEDAWSQAWTPWGQRVRFDRRAATRDDFLTELQAILPAIGKVVDLDEAREFLGLPPASKELRDLVTLKPAPPQLQQATDQTQQQDQTTTQEG